MLSVQVFGPGLEYRSRICWIDGRRSLAAAKAPQRKRPCRSRATACRSSFITRSIREAAEEARELLSAEAGYRCEIGDRVNIEVERVEPRLNAILIAARRPSWVSVSGPAMINSFFHGLESVARGQNLQNLLRIPIVREKLLNRPRPRTVFFALP
jgi:hypothetical protein